MAANIESPVRGSWSGSNTGPASSSSAESPLAPDQHGGRRRARRARPPHEAAPRASIAVLNHYGQRPASRNGDPFSVWAWFGSLNGLAIRSVRCRPGWAAWGITKAGRSDRALDVGDREDANRASGLVDYGCAADAGKRG